MTGLHRDCEKDQDHDRELDPPPTQQRQHHVELDCDWWMAVSSDHSSPVDKGITSNRPPE